ncbi:MULTISPECIES: hypothetical protein [Thermodesulfobacterium]|jgi:hypothetical protein|uniref:Uncharacterized protein n=2 Tax=Thermodesulfobacterium commune TaxID=1741 RepID=A0A075WV15_9BACT|nr:MULTISPECIES: hypothetical protein [Thermodesulfobacterium]KUJ97787.1 MAG: Uncharacterized protein XD42_0571 [Thermodesulfobacterium sp. 37_54]KUK19349.1 MAG: Uncharacterized protein XD55_0597 [Thermodesulfobacterium commune]AIH04746.1 hypothetical protein HL41_08880 [Thermodesulfobacterium commune DSM 2178]KUK38066.1 MAG: Uncharacterized protein XD67_0642 [Thermodesulfobacterium commune]MBZ4681344.1 hypothetical protein [Thermodesulfobacterium sp.]
MGGRSRKSVLKQKLAKYYKERENPLALLALQDEIIRQNQDKLMILEKNLEALKELEEKVDNRPTTVSKLHIRKISSEQDKKFANRAFYEVLYPITLEYRFMPLQAIFIWYLKALELVYGDKPPKIHVNRLQKWIKYWLTSLTPEQELQLKSAIISWILNRFT